MWHHVNGFLLAATSPSVEPTLRPGLSDRDVAPGLIGFLVTFALAIAVILIAIAMTRRVRKINHAQHANHTAGATIRTGTAPLDSSVLDPRASAEAGTVDDEPANSGSAANQTGRE